MAKKSIPPFVIVAVALLLAGSGLFYAGRSTAPAPSTTTGTMPPAFSPTPTLTPIRVTVFATLAPTLPALQPSQPSQQLQPASQSQSGSPSPGSGSSTGRSYPATPEEHTYRDHLEKWCSSLNEAYQNLDPNNRLQSLQVLRTQVDAVWDEHLQVPVPTTFLSADDLLTKSLVQTRAGLRLFLDVNQDGTSQIKEGAALLDEASQEGNRIINSFASR